MTRFWSVLVATAASLAVGARASNFIAPSDPLIWYHGRWDSGRGTWWTGTGFTLHIENLSSLSLQLGPNTTQPSVAVGVSVNYGPFNQLHLTNGTNSIALTSKSTNSITTSSAKHTSKSVVRLTVQGWENNNMYLEGIILNNGASLLRYKPSEMNFQLVSDSVGSGHNIAQGINGAWPFLMAETFKAEQQLNARSGACMSDNICWGNQHGLSYQFFKTEDTGYYTNPKHNYTTNWNFSLDYRPTHVFLAAGANDNQFNITGANLTNAYVDFIGKIRHLYPTQPIFIIGASEPNKYVLPDGTPNINGTFGYWADGIYETVEARSAMGDKKVYFVDTKGWVRLQDVISPTDPHLNPSGHIILAEKLGAWLKDWGLRPRTKWPTQPE